MAPGLIGASALAVETSDWYATHQALQIAADAGALAAARVDSTDTAVLETVAANAANAATGDTFKFSNATGNIAVLPRKTSNGVSVSVTTKGRPQQIIASILGPALPELSAQAGALSKVTVTPPPDSTCYSSNSYTYVTPTGGGLDWAHVAGIDPVKCGNTDLIQPLVNYLSGAEGQLVDQAIHLNDNNGSPLSSSLTNNKPSVVPDCNKSYDPNQPTTDASNPGSVTVDGVKTYFGKATVKSQTYEQIIKDGQSQYVLVTQYNFGPIVVGPGSSFCDSNNICTIPAGAYCGGIQINPGVTLNFVDSGGSNAFEILDGNLLMATADQFGATNDAGARFFFGGARIGSLILDTQTAIYASSNTTGTLVFTSSMTATQTNPGGIVSEDQVCPLGVLPIGVSANGTPQCPTELTATSGGTTTTTLDSSNTVNGQVTNQYQTWTSQTLQTQDTYTTTITFNNGVAKSWQAYESTQIGALDSNGQLSVWKNLGLNYSGQLGTNPTLGTTSSAPASCGQSASNSLWYSNTSSRDPSLGLSSATPYGGSNSAISLSDTVSACGTGPKFVSGAAGAEIIAAAPSGTGTSTVYLTR